MYVRAGYWQRADERLADATLRHTMVLMLRELLQRETLARGHVALASRALRGGCASGARL